MDEIETAANLIVATSAISRPADKLLSLRSTSLGATIRVADRVKMKKLRLALCQMNATVGDLVGNADKIIQSIDEARRTAVI